MPGSFVAAGNIAPSRFVKPDTATGKVVAASAGSQNLGVSQQGTRNTPFSSLDDGYCAIAGENVRVYKEGEECYIEAGASCSYGDLLKPTTNGKAIPVSANNDYYGARALEPASGDTVLIKCVVIQGFYGS